ncbi:MAG: hypothetical protein FJ278_21220, partial [Planctomycetes bacterium]|nr:hypothetical protein [Planctomycetota bacterium]
GYGGTLNLMFSLIFIAVVIGLIAAPCHLYFARDLLSVSAFRFWLVLALCAAAILSALATVLPLLIGLRSFRRLEF